VATKGISLVAPIGKRFGKLTVNGGPFRQGNANAVTCICDCGDQRAYFVGNLRTQKLPMCPSCRLLSRPSKGRSGKHPLFNIWKAMIQRCENPKHTHYSEYGGRGITICDRWRTDFDAFASDMGGRPTLDHTLDRIDVDGNYEPGNVEWSDWQHQGNNRRDNIQIEWRGRTLTGAEAAREAGIDLPTLLWRLKRGWVVEKAMTQPANDSP
jgi:hypothetical protein